MSNEDNAVRRMIDAEPTMDNMIAAIQARPWLGWQQTDMSWNADGPDDRSDSVMTTLYFCDDFGGEYAFWSELYWPDDKGMTPVIFSDGPTYGLQKALSQLDEGHWNNTQDNGAS